ncbi:hypothetical protein PMAYCL1PPCAC_03835, partial [Pristionchus mayeri]
PDLCDVCGDPAIGFHYDVASCSGCRSFFRRTIKQQKEYKCRQEGKCPIKKENEPRARCKACRLHSAIEAGMNPRALQSADIDIPTNKLAQMIITRQDAKRHAAAASVSPLQSPSPSVEDRVQRLIDALVLTKKAYDSIRASEFAPTPYDMYDLDKVFDSASKMGRKWGHMMDDEHLPVTLACAPPVQIMDGRLKWWPLVDCVYGVEYLRTFPFFGQLSRRDQRLLSVSTVSTIACLARSWYSTEQKSEVMVNPDGIRHNAEWQTVQDLQYDCEIITCIYRLKITESEYAIIKAIVSTDYDIFFLSDAGRELLEEYQSTYRKALYSLVMATRGPEGPKFYSSVLLMLSTLKKVTVWKKGVNRHVYPAYAGTMFACKIIEEILYEDPLLN